MTGSLITNRLGLPAPKSFGRKESCNERINEWISYDSVCKALSGKKNSLSGSCPTKRSLSDWPCTESPGPILSLEHKEAYWPLILCPRDKHLTWFFFLILCLRDSIRPELVKSYFLRRWAGWLAFPESSLKLVDEFTAKLSNIITILVGPALIIL